MSIIEPNDLTTHKTKTGRLLGVDLGDKTIGLSLSDTTWSIASPLKVIRRTSFAVDSQELHKVIQENEINALVVGLPMNMNGLEGPQAQKVRAFVGKFLRQQDIPLVLWDERFSTSAVTRTLLEMDLSRRKRSTIVDKMAATYILQGLLDRLKDNP